MEADVKARIQAEAEAAADRGDSHKVCEYTAVAEKSAWLDAYFARLRANDGKPKNAPPPKSQQGGQGQAQRPPAREPDEVKTPSGGGARQQPPAGQGQGKAEPVAPASKPDGLSRFEVLSKNQVGVGAAAARNFAAVQARHMMARQYPRKWRQLEATLLAECSRFAFAKKARYAVTNRGSGLSIGFAELALRVMGNADVECVIVQDDPYDPIANDPGKVVVDVRGIDFETNAGWSTQVSIPRTVERKRADGRVQFGQRANSFGEQVFVVLATAEEMFAQVNNFVARAAREAILHFVPRDVQDACELAVVEAIRLGAKEDPKAHARLMLSEFVKLGVDPDEVEEWLGKSLDAASPADVQRLSGAWTQVNEGAEWGDLLAAVRKERAAATAAEEAAAKGEKPADEAEQPPQGQTPPTGSKGEQARRAAGAG